MVKIVRTKFDFPNGLPGVKISFPLWDTIDSIDPKQLKGVYRGEILFFNYKSRVEDEKKINSNPMVLFEGVDNNGNIVGSNLMFYNTYYDPKTGDKYISRNQITPVYNMLKKYHWDGVYQSGERKSFIPCEKKNYKKLFGARSGMYLETFWRTYNPAKMSKVQNLNIDSALTIFSNTAPTFVKSKLYIN